MYIDNVCKPCVRQTHRENHCNIIGVHSCIINCNPVFDRYCLVIKSIGIFISNYALLINIDNA